MNLFLGILTWVWLALGAVCLIAGEQVLGAAAIVNSTVMVAANEVIKEVRKTNV